MQKEFVIIECCACSAVFAVTTQFQKNRLETRNPFWCPSGHEQIYCKSASQKVREEKDRENERKNAEIDAMRKDIKKLTTPKRGKKTK